MVWIDDDGMRSVSKRLAALRDELLPADVTDPPGSAFGAADLAAAAAAYVTQVRQVRIDAASQVDALSTDAVSVANAWTSLDRAAASQLRAF